MGRYRKIDTRIWNDAKMRDLSLYGKLVFLFILTHPNMTALGAMRATVTGMASELESLPEALPKGFPEGFTKGFPEAFSEACRKGMVRHDARACFVACPNFIKYNPPESPNVVKSWAGCLDMIPECSERDAHFEGVERLVKGFPKGFQKAFAEAFPKGLPKGLPKSMPNQEQEQEQEQVEEKNTKKESNPDLFGEPPTDPENDTPRTPSANAQRLARFAEFWAEYPRKTGKGAAEAKYLSLKPSQQSHEAIMTGLRAQLPRLREQNPEYIPHPATWLNQRRWEDDPAGIPVNRGGKQRPGESEEFSY